MKQCHLFISGFVQGVGFRHLIRSKANELGLRGWVKNVPDGSVEVLLQGDKSSIDEMIRLCRKGPFLSEVEEVKVEWKKLGTIYKSFEIL